MRLHIPFIVAVGAVLLVLLGAAVALVAYDPLVQHAAEEGVHRVPDVRVSMSPVGVATVTPSGALVLSDHDDAEVEITVSNLGPIDAEGVRVTLRSISTGWAVWDPADSTGWEGEWLGTIPPDSSETFRVQLERSGAETTGALQILVSYGTTGETFSIPLIPTEDYHV